MFTTSKSRSDFDPTVAAYWKGLAVAESRQNEEDKSAEAYLQALKLGPADADLYESMGHSLHSRGKLKEAESAFRKSLELDPARTWIYRSLEDTLIRMGRAEEAAYCHRVADQYESPLSKNDLVPLPPLTSEPRKNAIK